jgi:hypothetical protein
MMMRPLRIVWQRLVTSRGATCDRCGRTLAALQRAVTKLKDVLRPLDVEPVLETVELTQESFNRDPSASNRIWIAGRPLEEWLDARAGTSRCCSVCGEAECRTVEIGKVVFEAVSECLILKAALLATARMFDTISESGSDDDEARSCAPTCCVDALGL